MDTWIEACMNGVAEGTHMQASTRIVIALETLKGLFRETPNLHLSVKEASEISGLEPNVCSDLLAALVDVRFLAHEGDGSYHRPLFPVTDETIPPDATMAARPEGAELARLDQPRLA